MFQNLVPSALCVTAKKKMLLDHHASTKRHLFYVRQKTCKAPQMSYLQMGSGSICTYSVTLCTLLGVIIVCCSCFSGAEVHDVQSLGGGGEGGGEGLLYCFANGIPRQHRRWASSQDRKELFISLIFLLCIGRFIMLPFLLPVRQSEAVMRRCSRTSWPQM